MKSTIQFKTKLINSLLVFPKNVSKKFLSENKIMIEGMIDSLPFRAALELNEKNYCLKVNKAMQEALKLKTGEIVTIEITRVGEEPELRTPSDLSKVLAKTPSAEKGWKSITPMARRDWIFSITSTKVLETRERRIEKARSMLSSGKRRLCCFPGVKWIMKNNVNSWGMWAQLPKK
ncbi:Bacteriocin-protection, YdeI or OmpD-Associated [uncultured archaeon]|nr:Bacteriocin-protection, YdeI or OmpD-Associated [uncultured archaeon]